MCLRCSRWPTAETRAALRREADHRGIFLPDDVMDYLLTRFPRDLAPDALLDRLDELRPRQGPPRDRAAGAQMLAEEGLPEAGA
jgi:DnaA-homolog protein